MPANPTKCGFGLRLVIVVVVAAALVVGVYLSLRSTATVATAYKGKAIHQVPGSVTVEAEHFLDIPAGTEGTVLSTELYPGKAVKEGEVLVQLDPAVINLEIAHLQSDLDAAKSRLAVGSSSKIEYDNAKDALEKYEHEFVQGGLAKSEITKQRRLFDLVRMKVELEDLANKQLIEGLENAIKVKKNLRTTMTILAPYDGVIAVVYPGGNLKQIVAAKAPVASIISNNRTVIARISEENFADIQLKQKATVRFLSYGDTHYDASVIKILPTADPDTQRYQVYLEVKIDADKLVPGLTGEVSIVVAERENATLIPRRALFEKKIYVVTNGHVEQRNVEVGYTGLNVVEILKGLAVGEQVIVEELDKFRDGDRVRVQAEKK